MKIVPENEIQECIKNIDELIKETRYAHRADCVAFAMGYLVNYGAVPHEVLKHINNLYYDGVIKE